MTPPIHTIRELIAQSYAQYLDIKPSGFSIGNKKLPSQINATIVIFKPARTLYLNKKPTCRSLNGIISLKKNRSCADCDMKKSCTPQICLQVFYENIPLRLMLAYTSAKNFLKLITVMKNKGISSDGAHIRISVKDRGRWGEVCFELIHENNEK